jgi:hypothetical protein
MPYHAFYLVMEKRQEIRQFRIIQEDYDNLHIQLVAEPYADRWTVILVIILFISLFLVLFQPFGLHNLESGMKTWLLAGYGLVTMVVLVIDVVIIPLIFPVCFKEENRTFMREFLLLVWIVITISLVNYLYSVWLTIVHWIGIKGFLIFLGFTLYIAIIPIIGVIVISHNVLLKKNLKASGS